jgi:hypothetical protein
MSEPEDILRSERIRGVIIDELHNAARAGQVFGFSFEQIRCAYAVRKTETREGEIREAIVELVGHGLITVNWDDDLRGNFYFITARGLNFHRAGSPWNKIDEF